MDRARDVTLTTPPCDVSRPWPTHDDPFSPKNQSVARVNPHLWGRPETFLSLRSAFSEIPWLLLESLWLDVDLLHFCFTFAFSCRKVMLSYRWETQYFLILPLLLSIEIAADYCEEFKGNANVCPPLSRSFDYPADQRSQKTDIRIGCRGVAELQLCNVQTKTNCS